MRTLLLMVLLIPMLSNAQVGAKYGTIKKGKVYKLKDLHYKKTMVYDYTKYQEVYDFYGTSPNAKFYAVAFKNKAFEKKYMDTTVNNPKKFQSIVDPKTFKRDSWIDLRTNHMVYYVQNPAFDPNDPIPYSAIVYTDHHPLPVPDGPNGMQGMKGPNDVAPVISNPNANRTVVQPPKKH